MALTKLRHTYGGGKLVVSAESKREVRVASGASWWLPLLLPHSGQMSLASLLTISCRNFA